MIPALIAAATALRLFSSMILMALGFAAWALTLIPAHRARDSAALTIVLRFMVKSPLSYLSIS
jgi:hypothetical protein